MPPEENIPEPELDTTVGEATGGPAETGPQNETGVPVIHTYATDIKNAVSKKEGSVISIAMAEEKRRQAVDSELHPEKPKNNKFFILGGVIFLFAAIAIIYFAFVGRQSSLDIPNGTLPPPPSLIQSDADIPVDLVNAKNKEAVESLIVNAINSIDSAQGKVDRLYFFKTLAGGRVYTPPMELLQLMRAHTPGRLARAFLPVYTLGVTKTDSGKVPFVLLEANSFDTAFSGMLEWEKFLFDDFENIFSLVRPSSDPTKKIEFQDKLLSNQNARVVISDSGGIVFFYAFIGNKVLITDDPGVLKVVANHTW